MEKNMMWGAKMQSIRLINHPKKKETLICFMVIDFSAEVVVFL